MTHAINYTAESDGVTLAEAKSIMDAVLSWAGGGADKHFDGVAYDNVNSGMRISVRVTGVADINAALTSLDNGIDSINTNNSANFPPASDTADIRPEQK